MMDRRELIQRVAALMGGAISSSAIAGVLAGCVAAPTGGGDKQSFWTEQRDRVWNFDWRR